MGKDIRPYKTKAELVRTVIGLVQLLLALATLIILIVVNFL